MRGLGAPLREEDALAQSLPNWEPFPEVPAALEEARSRGWKLAILSNTDRDFIDASMARLAVPFELAIVASEIGSYKPAHRHWERFFEQTQAPREGHVHVAASLFHDIAPANELGLRSIWINRLSELPEPRPTRELRDLDLLPETLDELAPA
jgi:2-haloacid dehalogenase